MRQLLASLFVAGTLGGCSLIYNPSNLPPVDKDAGTDAPPDAEVILDADPTMLALTSVTPTTIYEGDGIEGSRPAVLVIHGMQIIEGAQVTLTEHGTTNAIASLTVDNSKAGVSANGFDLAVPVSAAIDPNMGPIGVDITVTQGTGASMVSKTLPAIPTDPAPVTLQGLPELDATAVLTPGTHEYSRIKVAALGVMPGAVGLDLRVHSSVEITGALTANAMGQLAGAGGSNGPPGANALATGAVGSGPAPGMPSGGGGGFGTPGLKGASGADSGTGGTPQVKSLAANKGSSGAAGSGGLSAAGGAAGGSGGTIVVTAGGMVTIGAAQAIGGNGSNPTVIGHGDAGGGGSGGLVLLRSNGPMMVNDIDVSGGVGTTGGNVGHGGLGRIRLDAPNVVAPTALHSATVFRGPMFATNTPLITREERPEITVTGQDMQAFGYYVIAEDGSIRGPHMVSILSGQNTFPLQDPLFRGLNTVCLLVGDSDLTALDEAKNCITLAFLYTP